MSVLDEVLAANKSTSRASATKGVGPATGSTVRNPDVHGRASRSGEVRRPLRRGRARDPKRWRSRERRRDPFSRHSYKLLGTKEWFVVHHSDCGMEFFTDESIRGLLSKSLETASLGPDGFFDVGKGPGSNEGAFIDWLTISTRSAPSLRTSSAFVVTPGSERYCDLRIRLRRSKWRARGGARGDESRRGEIIVLSRSLRIGVRWRNCAVGSRDADFSHGSGVTGARVGTSRAQRRNVERDSPGVRQGSAGRGPSRNSDPRR